MRVLLIEPDTVLAKTYIKALEHAGHVIDWQASAEAAIHGADQELPDLVILELKLTAHSGAEFLYEFRSYDDWQETPVIVHSSLYPAELEVPESTWDKLGVRAYYYKPQTTLDQLLEAVTAFEFIPA